MYGPSDSFTLTCTCMVKTLPLRRITNLCRRMKNTNSRLICWALALQPFNFSLKHWKGVDNANADGLSEDHLRYQRKTLMEQITLCYGKEGEMWNNYHNWTFAACLHVCCQFFITVLNLIQAWKNIISMLKTHVFLVKVVNRSIYKRYENS